jgi:hypothetical protein
MEKGTQMLCRLPAAQQLSGQQVLQLLAAAVQHRDSDCIKELYTLPRAQQLTGDQLMQCLLTAVQR